MGAEDREEAVAQRDARRRLVALLLAYLAFVVYGSLVPFDFHPLPSGEAWARFQRIPFLQLGVESRADWIANGVLYAPLAFLGTLALLQRRWPSAVASIVVTLAACVLAVAIEYAQLFFAPRTVSLNDLMAEAVGSGLGAAAAGVAWSLRDRWHPLRQSSAGWLQHHALPMYAAAYLAFSLFPYDFLISGPELFAKMASDAWGWWLAGRDGRPLLAVARLGAEFLLAAPLGAWLSARRPAGWPPLALLGTGVALGLGIELAQLLLASGVTQGASVVARASGVAVGAAAWARRGAWSAARLRALVQRSAPWAIPLYVLVLLGLNGWFSRAWVGPSHAADSLVALRWQPFYYHYYTSEAQALLSLASVALAYAPLGVWAWARGNSMLAAGLSAGLMSALVEGGKLFLPGLRPDPTNLLIAAAAASGIVWAAAVRSRSVAASTDTSGHGVVGAKPETRTTGYGSPGLWLLASAALVWQLVSAPPAVFVSTLAVITAAIAIAFRPALTLVILPAALPLFDLAPWTGRMLWDEFDLLLAVGLAVAWARTPPPAHPLPTRWIVGFALLSASLVVSAAIGFWPGAPFDVSALASYHTPYNALRILKGLLWAFLLVGLWRRLAAGGHDPAALFARGMALGLAGVVAWVLWERWTFAGFGDWAVRYRVTGPFSAMHRGGAFVECYIAVAMPFAAQAALSARRTLTRAGAALLVVAGSLSMMLTFSRNGYAALAIGLLAWTVLARAGKEPAAAIAALAVVSIVVLTAWPVASGDYARERLARWKQDLEVRAAHWRDALVLRGDSMTATIFGAGLGRYPSLHYWGSAEARRAAPMRTEHADDGKHGEPTSYVRLGSGSPTYLDQIVGLRGAREAHLALQFRSAAPGQRLTVSLCEKWMLTSAACVARTISSQQANTWQTVEEAFDLHRLAESSPLRPIKLALHAPTAGATIEVTSVSLTTPDGRALLVNGDFARGFDGWWMSTDVDPPYHVHSLPVAALLEQGWLGLLAWALMLSLALSCGAAAAWRRSHVAAATTAALLAFVVSAALNTLIDDPRFLLLVLMAAWGAVVSEGNVRQTHAGRPSFSRCSVARPMPLFLSRPLCERVQSFLPSFKGAYPHRQA